MIDPRIEGLRDAAAWLQATAANDAAGRRAIALNCDPTQLMDAMTDIVLWLVREQGLDFAHFLEVLRSSADRDERGTS